MATTTQPAKAVEHPNVHAALAAFQSELPIITKDSMANVATKSGGSYSYSYADLAAVVALVVPALGRQGIAWVCAPTLVEGRLMLVYGLHHGASSTSIEGVYPLSGGTPQEVGSAITYARRYTLLSLTGTFPAGEDDDGKAAADAYHTQRARERRPRQPEAAQPQAPTVDPDAPLVVSSASIDAAATVDALRDVYRLASSAQQLDRILPTGEAVRDAINSRRGQIVAQGAAAPAQTEAAEAMLDAMGQAVQNDGTE